MSDVQAVNQPDEFLKNKVVASTVTLANASTIVEHVIMSIVGNEISDSLNGSRLTMDSIRTIAQSRFQRHLKI